MQNVHAFDKSATLSISIIQRPHRSSTLLPRKPVRRELVHVTKVGDGSSRREAGRKVGIKGFTTWPTPVVHKLLMRLESTWLERVENGLS